MHLLTEKHTMCYHAVSSEPKTVHSLVYVGPRPCHMHVSGRSAQAQMVIVAQVLRVIAGVRMETKAFRKRKQGLVKSQPSPDLRSSQHRVRVAQSTFSGAL